MGLDKDDIKQLIAILQKGLSEDEPEDFPVEEIKPRPKIKKTISKNKFDVMPEAKMHKEDTEIDRRLNVQPPTDRSRTYKTVRVRCRVCGKNEEVNPSLVESIERYKCNKCSTSSG
jgi:predicted transcriptional regulator of viral defense system